MIGIIVCGHGNFATGIASTVRLVAGEQENFRAIDFNGHDDLAILLQQADKDLACEELIFFTDILGGAPFRQASLIAEKRGNCQVIAGVTAGMLIEACLGRDDYTDIENDIEELIQSARESITSLKQQLAIKKTASHLTDDGI